MSKFFKNIIKLNKKTEGPKRWEELSEEVMADTLTLPLPLEYEDIDKEFKEWVDKDLEIIFEGDRLPVFTLYSNQRFSEFLQSWDKVDEKKNLILNFKTITRENNPKTGTIHGNTKSIPGDYSMLIKRVETKDDAGRKYFIDYRMKQPFVVDLVYTLGLVTNKYELLNEFNQKINEKFKAINCYIRPNGHFLPMVLEDISDESEYNIDNRTYYSQNYKILVKAYIISKDSFIIEERPDLRIMSFDGDKTDKSYAEIEELPCWYSEDKEYEYIPMNIKIVLHNCSNNYKFTIDTNFHATKITMDNIRHFKFYINDVETILNENLDVKEGDILKFNKITRYKTFEPSQILIEGLDYKQVQKIK